VACIAGLAILIILVFVIVLCVKKQQRRKQQAGQYYGQTSLTGYRFITSVLFYIPSVF